MSASHVRRGGSQRAKPRKAASKVGVPKKIASKLPVATSSPARWCEARAEAVPRTTSGTGAPPSPPPFCSSAPAACTTQVKHKHAKPLLFTRSQFLTF